MLTRRAKVGLVLAPDGRDRIRLRKGEPIVTISGPIGELVLYVYGRKDVAQVELERSGRRRRARAHRLVRPLTTPAAADRGRPASAPR